MALNKRQKAILAATVPGKAYAIEEALKILKDNVVRDTGTRATETLMFPVRWGA